MDNGNDLEAPNGQDSMDSKDICFDCGGQCCKIGGVIATEQEIEAITQSGHQDYFERLSEDVYGTKWGEDGICAYFENNECSIHSVRPLGCRMFPVVQTKSGDIIVVECPLSSQLSDEELMERKEILIQRPQRIVRESIHHRENHSKDLQMRIAKWDHQLL